MLVFAVNCRVPPLLYMDMGTNWFGASVNSTHGCALDMERSAWAGVMDDLLTHR